jgi:uncharacterized protein
MASSSAVAPTCPRCATGLSPYRFGPVAVDACDSCGGVWFDAGELSQLAQGGRDAVDAAETLIEPPEAVAGSAVSAGQCPKCQVPLYQFEFKHTPGVTLDACPTCQGIWVDDRELAAIAQRLAPAAPAAPAPRSLRHKVRQASSFLQRVPCAKCQEENVAGSLVCWACGATMAGRKSGKLCPRCDAPLRYVTAEDLEIHPRPHVDHCPDCGGIWIELKCLTILMELDTQTLKHWEFRLSAEARGALDTHESDIICPACQVVLDERPYARDTEVRIDRCLSCRGTWLDSGELPLIKRISIQQDVWARSDDL